MSTTIDLRDLLRTHIRRIAAAIDALRGTAPFETIIHDIYSRGGSPNDVSSLGIMRRAALQMLHDTIIVQLESDEKGNQIV